MYKEMKNSERTSLKLHILIQKIFGIRCSHAQQLLKYSCLRVIQHILNNSDMYTNMQEN